MGSNQHQEAYHLWPVHDILQFNQEGVRAAAQGVRSQSLTARTIVHPQHLRTSAIRPSSYN